LFPEDWNEKKGIIPREIPTKYILSGWVMADLIFRDFVDLSGKNLVRVFSDKKLKIFGIQKLQAEEGGNAGT
jgi:hypothetical protein